MKQRGFTFIELVVGISIFVIFALGAYQGFSAVFASIASAHHKALAADLANEQFEIAKNLPYASLGTIGGTPAGVLPVTQNFVRDRITFVVTLSIQNVDDPFDGTSTTTPADAFPADYKLMQVRVTCTICKNFAPVSISGFIAPKNLES